MSNGKSFLWVSEKDGWRHIYLLDRNGKETLVTKGDYDIDNIKCIDEKMALSILWRRRIMPPSFIYTEPGSMERGNWNCFHLPV
jgi:hypothetical protein